MKSKSKEVVDKFAKNVIKQARTRLTKKKTNATKELYKSLRYSFKSDAKKIKVTFLMAKHGLFVDEGVKGVGGTKANGEKWKVKRTTGKYKYKNKMPPPKAFNKWLTIKGKGVRDKKGRFIKRKAAAFAVAKVVYHQGIERTDFFTKPFDLYYKGFLDDIHKAYSEDIDDLLKDALND